MNTMKKGKSLLKEDSLVKILDTTIRDGSYAIDFKFSCNDVAEIVKKLEKLNIDYIEIGHGMGLNASSPQNGISLHTDIEYMEVAKDNLKKSNFGFFCIPGIARIEDLKTAKKYGVTFVRVGVNADQLQDAIPYVEAARNIGLIVMVNFMKSYIISPKQFGKNVKMAEKIGAEYVYLVDSAGGMLPEQIKNYYEEAKDNCNIKLGFHGHNNMGLAVSNTVFCVENGFDIVDCSLQGLGRSSGNASTEMLIMTLKKKGYDVDIDIPRLLEYGYVLLRDIKGNGVQNPLDLICGYTDFHSSYLKYIYKCCNELNVDPLRLIIAYSKIDKKNMHYEKLCDIAKTLPRDYENHPYKFTQYFRDEV